MYYQFIYEWQTLIGALAGAAIPISLWFLKEWYQKYENHKKHLYNLEKFLVYNINSVIDAYNTINHFIEGRLSELINNINKNTSNKTYSVDRTFFPLFTMNPIDENILDLNTRSGYLDNKIVQIFKMSKDFALGIDDFRQQFTYTVEFNKDMAFKKLNSPSIQNELYRRNIKEFRNVVKRDLFEKNIKIYMRILVSTRIGINTFRDLGIIRWKFKFSPSFKYFKNKQELKKFRDDTYGRIDKFLKEKIDIEVQKMEALYTK